MPQKVLIIYFDKKGVNKLCVLILEKFIFKRIELFNMLYKSNINDLTKNSYHLCKANLANKITNPVFLIAYLMVKPLIFLTLTI